MGVVVDWYVTVGNASTASVATLRGARKANYSDLLLWTVDKLNT